VENKIQTAKEYLNVQPVKAQRKEIPQDWDRNINVSAENVEIKGRDGKVKIEFRVELHSYVDKVRLAVNKYGNAIINARGYAIKRAVDLAMHKFLEREGISVESVSLGYWEKKIERKIIRTSEIRITVKKQS